MNIKDAKEIQKELEQKTNNGFGYFMKNVGMVVLMFLVTFILTNPQCITNTTVFFQELSLDSLWVVLVLFLAVCGFYQLSKSIQKDNSKERKSERIQEWEQAIKKVDEDEREKHNELIQKRMECSPFIANELKSLLINLDADRAAILEMHNGTNNLAGLPCIYGDMIYEEISPRVHYARDEFKNFNLARLPFVALHYNERSWIGAVDEIDEEDPYFAAKLRMVEVNYGACITLEGIHGPLGFLTVFFKDKKDHPSKAKIMAEVTHSAQIISTLLDTAHEISHN